MYNSDDMTGIWILGWLCGILFTLVIVGAVMALAEPDYNQETLCNNLIGTGYTTVYVETTETCMYQTEDGIFELDLVPVK